MRVRLPAKEHDLPVSGRRTLELTVDELDSLLNVVLTAAPTHGTTDEQIENLLCRITDVQQGGSARFTQTLPRVRKVRRLVGAKKNRRPHTLPNSFCPACTQRRFLSRPFDGTSVKWP
jgi:hypothetical protein